ncbi:MAG: hypothetical protein F7B60_03455 [Desulfurococcales archaeon]|nr:hypothetical protein [Desulfurococcales archaeon]
MRVDKRRFIVLVFGAFLLAIIIGELAVFFFMGSRGRTGGLTGQTGLECGKWTPPSLNQSVVPGYPQITVAYSLTKVSELGDFVLKVIFHNNGRAAFNLDTILGSYQNSKGDMIVVVFDKYGFIDQKPLIVRQESRIVASGLSSIIVFKLHLSVTDPVYSMLVIPRASIRLSAWMKNFNELRGVCGSNAENLDGAVLVERWVTLLEGLTVFESYIESNGEQATINITGDDGTVYRASIYDNRGVLIQLLESPIYFEKSFSFNGLLVLGVSAGQIRGEPYTIEVFNSFNTNGVQAQGYKKEYSTKPWPDTTPGKWVAGQYKIDLDNGLTLKIEFAYNGYILVIRDGDLYNPSNTNVTFKSLIPCSPTKEYPIPAIKFSSGNYYPSWLVLNVTSKMVKPVSINNSLALEITIGSKYHIKSRGWAIVEAPYKKGGKIPVYITMPWCKKVEIDLSEFYR